MSRTPGLVFVPPFKSKLSFCFWLIHMTLCTTFAHLTGHNFSREKMEFFLVWTAYFLEKNVSLSLCEKSGWSQGIYFEMVQKKITSM
jgi:hypothetical protein